MAIFFYYGRLSSAQLDCWQALTQRPITSARSNRRHSRVFRHKHKNQNACLDTLRSVARKKCACLHVIRREVVKQHKQTNNNNNEGIFIALLHEVSQSLTLPSLTLPTTSQMHTFCMNVLLVIC